MKSVIKEMLHGKIGNFEQIKSTPEYFNLLDKVIVHETKLMTKLSSHTELSELYKKVSIALDQLFCESEALHYAEGFRFGLLLGLEINFS